MDFCSASWLNPPGRSRVTEKSVSFVTDPHTDFWQRTYYGFRNDSAHALLVKLTENFSFSCRVSFNYRRRFDQCGLVIYQNSECWFKASIEHENETLGRLGSVVTNHGHSDWATRDIPAATQMWYRLSRRGPDFLIETSDNGGEYRQMRVFHLHALGDTRAEQCRQDRPRGEESEIRAGLYACSPEDSSFTARFDCFDYRACGWPAHK